jgi:hypothetical protein
MMIIDGLKITLFVGITAAIIAAACLGSIAWLNAGSRNLALATAAFVGAFFLLIVQLPFELRSHSIENFFNAEYTVDRKYLKIRQWRKAPKMPPLPELEASKVKLLRDFIDGFPGSMRMGNESDASKFIAEKNIGIFNGPRTYREKLTTDLALYSLVTYMLTEHFDWQKQTKIYYSGSGKSAKSMRISQLPDCSIMGKEEIQQMLASAGNMFGEAPILTGMDEMCLPPGSRIEILPSKLKINNPFFDVTFSLEMEKYLSHMKPRTQDKPVLPNNEPQFETRQIGITGSVKYSWLRAQHRDMPKYKVWCKKVLDEAKMWFEAGIVDNTQQVGQVEQGDTRRNE